MDHSRADIVWKALADPTRRLVLDLLGDAPRTTGELCSAFASLSRFAVMKHLRVLQEAGLLLARKDGRQVWNHLNPVPLREVYERWVGSEASRLSGGLVRLRTLAERAGDLDEAAGSSGELERVLARVEVLVEERAGRRWRSIAAAARRDLAKVTRSDDATLEGEWVGHSKSDGASVRVRICAMREPRRLRVVVTATAGRGGMAAPPAGFIAAAASWMSA